MTLLQSHASIVEYTRTFLPEINATIHIPGPRHIPHIFSETNSATCGGGGISSTFGAGLWVVDYSLQALSLGTRRLLFHQGTIGDCAYCWWGENITYAPFYGAYFAAEALSGGTYVSMVDSGIGDIGVYAIWTDVTSIGKVLVYNSDYYEGDDGTTRSNQTVTLSLSSNNSTSAIGGDVKLLRMTAPSATSEVEEGENPSIGGMQFSNDTCAASNGGVMIYESLAVADNEVNVTVGASEAVIVYLS